MVKKGFTLMEMMVVLTILSIFFAAASKTMAGRAKRKQQLNPHGSYTCIYLNGTLKEVSVRETLSSNKILESDEKCRFQPPPSIPFFVVNIISGNYGAEIRTEPQIALPLYIEFPTNEAQVKLTNTEDVSITYTIPNSPADRQNFINHLRTQYPNSPFLSGEHEDVNDDGYGYDLQGRGVLISW